MIAWPLHGTPWVQKIYTIFTISFNLLPEQLCFKYFMCLFNVQHRHFIYWVLSMNQSPKRITGCYFNLYLLYLQQILIEFLYLKQIFRELKAGWFWYGQDLNALRMKPLIMDEGKYSIPVRHAKC